MRGDSGQGCGRTTEEGRKPFLINIKLPDTEGGREEHPESIKTIWNLRRRELRGWGKGFTKILCAKTIKIEGGP